MSSYGEYLERQLRLVRKSDRDAVQRQLCSKNREYLDDLWREAERRCYSQGVFRPSDELVHACLLSIWLERLTPTQKVAALRSAGRSL